MVHFIRGIVDFTGGQWSDQVRYELLAFFGLFLIIASSLINLLLQSKRGMIICLAIQYLGVFLLIIQAWSIGLSAVKLIAGWMAATFLSAAHMSEAEDQQNEQQKTTGGFFKISTGLFGLLVVLASAESIRILLPVPLVFIWAGMTLICLGFLQMATSAKPLKVIIGLLTTLSGFEVVYSAVENSVLVAGLASLVTMGIALIGSYLMVLPQLEKR